MEIESNWSLSNLLWIKYPLHPSKGLLYISDLLNNIIITFIKWALQLLQCPANRNPQSSSFIVKHSGWFQARCSFDCTADNGKSCRVESNISMWYVVFSLPWNLTIFWCYLEHPQLSESCLNRATTIKEFSAISFETITFLGLGIAPSSCIAGQAFVMTMLENQL